MTQLFHQVLFLFHLAVDIIKWLVVEYIVHIKNHLKMNDLWECQNGTRYRLLERRITIGTFLTT